MKISLIPIKNKYHKHQGNFPLRTFILKFGRGRINVTKILKSYRGF